MNSVLEPRWVLEVTKSIFLDLFHLFLDTWLKIIFYLPKLFLGKFVYDVMLPVSMKSVNIWTNIVSFLPQKMASYLRWCPTSDQQLTDAEDKILSYVTTPYTGQFINISQSWTGQDLRIWTILLNPLGKRTPLVLFHGFGLGVAQWVLNYDKLAVDRPVYALDIPGFGRSSRVHFGSDPQNVELRLVECFEAWRQELGLDHFILLGHDFGGFLATSYALQHPSVVDHLILVDPWGFPEQSLSHTYQMELPFYIIHVARFFSYFNPLAILRFFGPLGPNIVKSFRKDLGLKFASLIRPPSLILDYVYHANVQNPTGEEAKKIMTQSEGWAKFPMINRMTDLDEKLDITFIHGSRSMVDKQPGRQIQHMRLNSIVNVETIQGGGIHVYADKSEHFNKFVIRTCQEIDSQYSRTSSYQTVQESL